MLQIKRKCIFLNEQLKGKLSIQMQNLRLVGIRFLDLFDMIRRLQKWEVVKKI